MPNNSTIAIELTFLNKLRKDLANYINRMGVTASETETLKELVPKVLLITQGNPFTGYFDGRFTKTPIMDDQYSTFLYGSKVTLNGCVDIIGYFKMSSCTLTLTGTNLNALTITAAPEWTINVNTEGTTATLTRQTSDVSSGGLMTILLNDIKFSAISDVTCTCTFTAIEDGTNAVKTATGSTSFKISKNSWERIEDLYTTWNILSGENESDGYTWNEVENLVFRQ